MSQASIQILEFISYCSPVQSRMAGASIGVYEFNSVVRREAYMFIKVCNLQNA